MSEFLLTPEQRSLRDEARAFVREKVSRQLLLDMDAEKIHYPREYIQQLASARLLGLRFSSRWGGRALNWSCEVLALDEIGVLGASLACLYSLPSIVGEAIHCFGTDEQRRVSRLNHRRSDDGGWGINEPRGGSISSVQPPLPCVKMFIS
jgi:alkylation response protein AidB-like acyl-CoA dehydrogenase